MQKLFYIDTCIWRDYFEMRTDKFRSLGDWAFELIKKIINSDDLIIISNVVEKELSSAFSGDEISKILSIIPAQILKRVRVSKKQLREAITTSRNLSLPTNYVLHGILARDSNAKLITRDKHFAKLKMIVESFLPEEII